MSKLIAEPPLPQTPLERLAEHQRQTRKLGQRRWTFDEAFLVSVHEEIATELIAQAKLTNKEIVTKSKTTKNFVQNTRFWMMRSGEYKMRRDLELRKHCWYSFLNK
jgi:hypothetical protein